jgi:hypothetical protein
MLANFSTCAPGAARSSSQRTATVAFSAPTALCPVRQSKPSVRPVRPPAAQPSRREQGRKIDYGLGRQRRHKRSRVVDTKGRHHCRSIGPRTGARSSLDRRTPLDGDSVHLELAAMRAHSLPLYGPLLSRHDRATHLAGFRANHCQFLRLACAGRSHCFWRMDYLVGHGTGVGEILVTHVCLWHFSDMPSMRTDVRC